MQRWHARVRAGCGLAVVSGKAGASELCNCTCSAVPETPERSWGCGPAPAAQTRRPALRPADWPCCGW
jgi:hypothetical protein